MIGAFTSEGSSKAESLMQSTRPWGGLPKICPSCAIWIFRSTQGAVFTRLSGCILIEMSLRKGLPYPSVHPGSTTSEKMLCLPGVCKAKEQKNFDKISASLSMIGLRHIVSLLFPLFDLLFLLSLSLFVYVCGCSSPLFQCGLCCYILTQCSNLSFHVQLSSSKSTRDLYHALEGEKYVKCVTFVLVLACTTY